MISKFYSSAKLVRPANPGGIIPEILIERKSLCFVKIDNFQSLSEIVFEKNSSKSTIW